MLYFFIVFYFIERSTYLFQHLLYSQNKKDYNISEEEITKYL